MVNSIVTMEGCGKFIKYAVFIVNFIIFLGGLVICGVGIWTLADKGQVEKLVDTNLYVSTAAILVSMGGLIAIISFMGCCGALKEVKCLLLTFFIILLIIFIILLGGAIAGFVFKDRVSGYVKDGMSETIKKYDADKVITEAWNEIQQEFKCCGIMTPGNWTLNDNFKGANQVPASCCKDNKPDCQQNPNEENSFTLGCYSKVEEQIKKHAGPLAGIAIAIALVLILGMIFSCALFLMI